MTKTNKVGFIVGQPIGYALGNVNAFEMGARSVNPKVQTIVVVTNTWSDKSKEAAAANALLDQGCDIVTMHVDSPATIIQTAEARGAMSIGFQSIEARKLAPKGWITGLGFTWGRFMTQTAQSVINGTFKPGFVRLGIAEGMMAVAPFGPSVPADAQKLVNDSVASLAKGFNPFTGPITDNKGVVRIAQGESWGGDKMGNFDWFVEGVIGQAK
jgi:basic membrane lipoprotein Med (substrate-binding protein (PBP1-ABC) superfamily)